MSDPLPITIDFRDGFYHDTVIVTDHNQEVFRQKDVTTATMTGFAGSTILELDKGKHTLRFRLKEKEVDTELTIEISKPLYLGLEYIPGKGLEFRIQEEPFKYM